MHATGGGGVHAVGGFGLHEDAVSAAGQGEVVGVDDADGGLQRFMQFRQRHAERGGADFVDLGQHLWHGGTKEHADAGELGTGAQGGLELLDVGRQSGRIVVLLGLKVEFEAAGGADAADSGRIHHEAHAVGLRHADGVELAREGFAARRTLSEIFQGQEDRARVRALAAAEQVEPADGEGVADGRVLAQLGREVIHEGLRAVDARAVRESHHRQEVALVFRRQEAARDGHDERDVGKEDAEEAAAGRARMVEEPADHAAMPGGDVTEAAAEAVDEPGEPTAVAGDVRLEHERAERRGQGERDEAGQDDREGHGDGELTIEHARDAAEEGDGQEHADEHADDGDDRARDLTYRFLGGVEGTHPLLAHEPLGVLEDDDGVVDHDADGDDHREERQDVDPVAHDPQAGAGADQRDGHGDHGDERRAPGAEEEEDDDRDQQRGLEERIAHLADGRADEPRGVEGDRVGDVGRELPRQFVHTFDDAVGGLERVGTGLQEHADAGHGLAVEHAQLLVALGTELDAGDVAEAQHALAGAGAQDDLAELLRRGEAAAGHYGHHEGGVDRGFLAEPADGVLGVGRADGADHLGGTDAERGHAVRPQPHAHGVVAGAEDADVADAGEPLELLDDGGRGVVAEEDGVTRGVGRDD